MGDTKKIFFKIKYLKTLTWSSLQSSGETAPLKAAAAASQEAEVSSSNSRSRSKALWGVLTK